MALTSACLKRIGNNVTKHKLLLLDQDQVTIGRSPEVTYLIPSTMISRIHVFLQQRGGIWFLRDNKSLNGTEVNGVKLSPMESRELHDQDIVELGLGGEFVFQFHSNYQLKRKIPSSEDITLSKRIKQENAGEERSEEEVQLRLGSRNNVEAVSATLNSQLKTMKELKQTVTQEANVSTGIAGLHELRNQEIYRRKEYEERLAEMERSLHEKEKEQVEIKIALEEEIKRNEHQAKILGDLQEKEIRMKSEFENQQQSLQREKDEVMCKMRQELEVLVKKREEELIQQLKDKQDVLNAEKREVELRLQQEKAKALEQKDKQLERELRDQQMRLEQIIANKELAQKALERQLHSIRDENQKQRQEALNARQEILSSFTELIETELQCSICNELFIKATSLNCSHSFCEVCINSWMKRKKECPICRAKITTHMRSIVIDSYIDRMVDALSDELKVKRRELVESRREEQRKEDAAEQANTVLTSARGRGRGARGARGRGALSVFIGSSPGRVQISESVPADVSVRVNASPNAIEISSEVDEDYDDEVDDFDDDFSYWRSDYEDSEDSYFSD